ncbi:uncharacterized protein isoform X2 [Musca autumnalis]
MDTTSNILNIANDKFKSFLLNYDWLVYTILGILLTSCLCYYLYDYKRIRESRRRRHEMQIANQRAPQQRRPGASYRDHEIFHNVLQTTRQYVEQENNNHISTPLQPYVSRFTRSGRIYGDYYEE